MAYQVTYSSTLPLAVPTTTQYDYSSYAPHSKYSYSVSPPDAPESTISAPSGCSATTASSYAGSSAGDYETGSSSSGSAAGVDMQEYLTSRFEGTFDPLPLDRTLAKQAQTSGLLNAKHRELMDLQQLAQQRLAKSRARMAEGYQDAKEVKRDLEWTQKRVSAMKTKASRKHPKEYKQARARYPSPEY